MPKIKGPVAGGKLLNDLIDCATADKLPCVTEGRDLKHYARAFRDGDLVNSCLALIENDLNVSRTASKLYMHRNTLIYRISKMKSLTGLDVLSFEGAASFVILYKYFIAEEASE